MTTDEYYDEENFKEVLGKLCKCEHNLGQHANTMQYNYSTKSSSWADRICTS